MTLIDELCQNLYVHKDNTISVHDAISIIMKLTKKLKLNENEDEKKKCLNIELDVTDDGKMDIAKFRESLNCLISNNKPDAEGLQPLTPLPPSLGLTQHNLPQETSQIISSIQLTPNQSSNIPVQNNYSHEFRPNELLSPNNTTQVLQQPQNISQFSQDHSNLTSQFQSSSTIKTPAHNNEPDFKDNLNLNLIDELFKIINVNKDSKISLEDVLTLLITFNSQLLGQIWNQNDIELILNNDLDVTGDGLVDFNQLRQFLRRMLSKFMISEQSLVDIQKDLPSIITPQPLPIAPKRFPQTMTIRQIIAQNNFHESIQQRAENNIPQALPDDKLNQAFPQLQTSELKSILKKSEINSPLQPTYKSEISLLVRPEESYNCVPNTQLPQGNSQLILPNQPPQHCISLTHPQVILPYVYQSNPNDISNKITSEIKLQNNSQESLQHSIQALQPIIAGNIPNQRDELFVKVKVDTVYNGI